MFKALRAKRRRVALAGTVLALTGTAGIAYAVDSAVYWNGYIAVGDSKAGPNVVYLHYSEGASNGNKTICVDALYQTGDQYGSVICTNNSTGTHNTYPNRNTILRAWGRPTTGNNVDAKLRWTTW